MEKRYQVFLSSAAGELPEERLAVVSALRDLNCWAACAEPGIDPAAVERLMQDCDYCFFILGSGYNSIDIDRVEMLEREYEVAILRSRPVMAFSRTGAGLGADAGELTGRLRQFRERLEAGSCRHWTTLFELSGAAARAASQLIQCNPAEGWVRARYARAQPDRTKTAGVVEQIYRLARDLAQLEGIQTAAGEEQSQEEDLPRAEESVELEYTLLGDPARFHIRPTWAEVFLIAATRAVDLPSRDEIGTELSAWIGEQSNSFDVALSQESVRAIQEHFFSLGLMETRAAAHGEAWALTARGRALLDRMRSRQSSSAAV